MARLYVKIKDQDNVVVAVQDLKAGTEIMDGLVTNQDIPQAHKIALCDIPAGGEIIRYGVVLGYAVNDIKKGDWINEHMLELPESPSVDDMEFGTNLVPNEELPMPTRTTWMGYRNAEGPAGTRNLLGIVTTVQCAAGVLKVAVEKIKKELLPKYPNVDDVVAVNHPYGCGVAINAPMAYIPIRAITNVIRHPNFGGEIMVVGLGCEKLTYDRVLPPEDITPENVLTLQDYAGHDAMMNAIMEMAEKKLQKLNLRKREELPLSELLIGMQCGGSKPAETTAAPAATEAAKEAAAPAETEAASWAPSTTVSIVVPAAAGGNTDLSARVFAQYAKEITGADFIVVNANGAAGSVAANQVLQSAADGHTFLYGHNLVNVANIAGVTDYNYTAFKLGPTFAKDPAQQLYVNPDKYADLNAFIEAAKAAPGQLKACTEVGAYTYYEILEFEKQAGIDLDLVDVGSNADKIAAMLSGQVDLMPGAYINCKDYLAAGQFACLGVPSEERYELIADIPTLKEQGVDLVYPDCDFSFYFPAETPDEVITYYENLVQQVLADPEAAEGVANVDMMPYYLSAEDSAKNDEAIYNTIKGIADALAQ